METISFRKYQISDIDDFMSWACDPGVLRYSSIGDWINENSPKEEILSGYFAKVVIPHPWYRAICLNNKPIGFISIEPSTKEEYSRNRAEISGALGRHYWSRGIMAFAGRKAVTLAFKENPHLNRIQAIVDTNNMASIRMLQKVGFLKEGVLRNYYTFNGKGFDYIMFSIVPDDLLTKSKL